MKIRFLFLFLLCSVLTPAYSQNKIYWQENFDKNERGWLTGDRGIFSGKIENGKYIFTQKREGSFGFQFKSVPLDPDKDFTIESVITQIEGTDNNGFGIVWGALDINNFNICLAKSNSMYAVFIVRDGRLQVIKDWTKADFVKPTGEKNTFKIIQKGKNLQFLLNDSEAFSGQAPKFAGTNLGIITLTAMTIACEGITVKQDNPINVVPKIKKGVLKENLGENINNQYEQVVPVIAPDGNTLYWSTSFSPENTGGALDGEEIWYSTLQNGKWSKYKNIGRPLNNREPNWVISVTPDNNTMLIANQYRANGESNGGGLSQTHRTKDGWSLPENVNIKNLDNRGTSYNFCLSNDRKILLMTIKRGDTYGGNDVYVCFLQADGSWSEPKNLGKTINTFADELTPFLAADGITLYYSSMAKPGYGDADIFMSKRLDDSWTNWSEPKNLGPEINSPMRDAGFTLTASGEYGYLTSSSNSLGGSDIFRMKIPDAIKPEPVVLVYGKVLNSKTKEPLETNIIYRELSTDKEVGLARSNPSDGSYKIILPAGRAYSFLGAKENFYSISENFDVKKLLKYKEIEKNLFLTPVEVGATILLNNIFFDFGKAVLRSESFPELARAVDFLKLNPQISVEVNGHTDNVGNDANNQKLSEDRAKAVADYLVSKNIPRERISSKGYGKTKPIKTNDTEENRQFNRRVEFTILKK
ncbi:MAG: OmpA family protein [Bacteroidota bacterium]